MTVFFKILALFSIPLLFTYNQSFDMNAQKEQCDESLNLGKKTKRKIVLLGASIGRSWNIPSLSARINDKRYVFEYIHGGGFDKSKKLREITSRRENKPDAIFLKQCAGEVIISLFTVDLRKTRITCRAEWVGSEISAEIVLCLFKIIFLEMVVAEHA